MAALLLLLALKRRRRFAEAVPKEKRDRRSS
jgi:hypothetical protein